MAGEEHADSRLVPRRERLRTLGRGAGLGIVLGAGGVLLAALAGVPARDANGVVFPLGAMAFGFGMATWASALLYGTTLERGARKSKVSQDFSSERAADAMALLMVVGFGGMVGGTVATLLVRGLLA